MLPYNLLREFFPLFRITLKFAVDGAEEGQLQPDGQYNGVLGILQRQVSWLIQLPCRPLANV